VEPAALAELPETPEMPALPDLSELAPLPEIPEMPVAPAPAPAEVRREAAPKVAVRAAAASSSSTKRAAGQRQTASAASGRGSGQGNGSARGAGSSAVGSDRWVGGRMPKPNYPSAARRSGQQGRVVVQFTVDERGYVVDAKITGSCAHSILNEEALRTVRRWKFRPGPRASASRPIVFQLN
jgi:protein TonB